MALDINPAQTALLELKRAAYLHLDYAALLAAMTGDACAVYPALRPRPKSPAAPQGETCR